MNLHFWPPKTVRQVTVYHYTSEMGFAKIIARFEDEPPGRGVLELSCGGRR